MTKPVQGIEIGITRVTVMNNEKLIIKPKCPKGEDGYKVFSVRIKEETVSKIDDISA